MPTFGWTAQFGTGWARLSPADQTAFLLAVRQLVADIRAGRGFRKGLRVKGVRGHDGVFEMTWADDGRATFNYGDAIHEGKPHVVWRRIGTHDVFRQP